MRDLRISKWGQAILCMASLCLLVAVFATPAFASPSNPQSQATKDAYALADKIDAEHTITVDSSIIEADFKHAVQSQLDWVRDNGDGETYRIIIPSGDYDFGAGNGLHIYSNTILDCRNDVTIRAGSVDGLLLRAGDKFDFSNGTIPTGQAGGYDDYTNITILGGTWIGKPRDGFPNGYDGVNIRFGHASNIKLLGMTIKDNYDAHHVELGGVKDCVVADCAFSGAYGKARTEALQLDVVHREKDNFTGYYPFDDLATCDTTVEYCTFDNLARGVGSHHIVLDAQFNNITIKNNTFSNIDDRAIGADYFTNSTIADNTMTNVQSGIFATCMVPRQTYLKNNVNTYSGSKTTNGNVSITNNTIKLSPTGHPSSDAATKYGIRAGGDEITSNEANYTDYITSETYGSTEVTKSLPTGKYLYSNITISNNNISASGTAAAGTGTIDNGIRADFLGPNSTITNNTIDLGNCDTSGKGRGILVRNSKDVNANKNTINNVSQADGSGIVVQLGSTGIALTNNNITNSGAFGIMLNENAEVSSITGNTITTAKTHGIYVTQATAKNINSNTISGTTDDGIRLNNNGKATSINKNKITNPGQYGIGITANSTVSNANENTITGSKNHGIYLTKSDVTGSITNNTITGAKGSGISVNSSGKAGSILENKITNPGQYGINVANSSTVANINENTISGSKNHGIYAAAKATATNIKDNTITGAATDGIRLRDGAKSSLVATNTITNAGGCGVFTEGIASIKIDGNTITGSKGSGIRAEKSSKANIVNNKVKTSKVFGIYVPSSANATIDKNTVEQTTDQGIYVNGSANTKITNNTSTSTINKTTKYEYKIINSKSCTITGNKYGPRREVKGKTDAISYDAASKPAKLSNNTPINGKPSNDVKPANTTVKTTPVYWIVSKRTGENLYTTSWNEVRTLCIKNKTWINKGIMWYAPDKGKPVYRLVNRKTNDHHFTMDANEVKQLTKVKKTWNADFGGKPIFYSGGDKPIWRLWSESRWAKNQAGTHRFATYNAKMSGWKNEGIKLYAQKYK